MFKGQEPITRPVTLADAMARAIKYNLDHRVKMMELALSAGQLDVQQNELLPQLSVTAGYDTRNNDSGGESLSILTGQESLQPSTSTTRSHVSGSAGLAWNVLDFGVSYVRAHEQANQVLIAEEKRRKVIQNIIQDVNYAWWRAASAQRLLPQLDSLRRRIAFAVDHSERIEQGHLMQPLQALAYQRAMLDIGHAVVQQQNQLVTAKTELAALMNLQPGTEFTLALPPGNTFPEPPPPLTGSLAKLEDMALLNRPELREEDVKSRITREEAHRALLSLLPGINLSMTESYDSNKYLYNNTWAEAGLSLSGNLMKLFSYGATKRLNEAQTKLDTARRMALEASVLTQLHIADEHYRNNWVDYRLLSQTTSVDSRIADNVRSATRIDAEAELELIRAQARALLSKIQRDVAYASLQSDYWRILNSIGYDPLPESVKKTDVADLASALAKNIQAIPQLLASSEQRQVVARQNHLIDIYLAPLSGVTPVNQKVSIHSFRQMIESAGVHVVQTPSPHGYTLLSTVKRDKPDAGVVKVRTVWQLKNAAGKLIHEYIYVSYLAEPTSESGWKAYLEASATAAASELVPQLLMHGAG